jgi:hypothetical protein
LEPIAATVHDRAELDTVIAAQAREPNGGLIVIPDGFLNVHRADIIALAARYRLPAIYPWRFFAEEGGLTEVSSAIFFGLRRPMWTASSRARSRPTCQRRPSISW